MMVIYKVGLCVVRCALEDEPELLFVRPKGKRDSQAPFVLPRGTRQYADAQGMMHDARDAATAMQFAEQLEPLKETARREAREEAGVPPEWFDMVEVIDMGARDYFSPSGKGSYPVYWYVMEVPFEQSLQLLPAPDSAECRFMNLEVLQGLALIGQARDGYVPVAEEALKLLGYAPI
jgi:8-oxo-dGTP pyrophosphatase MutT (NUDIX family)